MKKICHVFNYLAKLDFKISNFKAFIFYRFRFIRFDINLGICFDKRGVKLLLFYIFFYMSSMKSFRFYIYFDMLDIFDFLYIYFYR